MINKNVTIITGTKSGLGFELAKLYKDNSLDFIFIDADHSYEGVMKDYLNSLNFITNGAL